jgi:hypothetical protein
MSEDSFEQKEVVRIKFPAQTDSRGLDFVDVLKEQVEPKGKSIRDLFDKGKNVEAHVYNFRASSPEKEAHYTKNNKERIDLSKAHRMEFKGEERVDSSE